MKIQNDEIKGLLEDYEYDPDIMSDEDERVRKIKYALTQIPITDRIIFLLETEYHSQRKVGEMLGISHSTVGKVVKQIKEKILEIINDLD